MTCRISLRSLTVVILAIGIIQRSAAQTAQRESAVEPALLDKPLIFDSSTRGPGGTKIPQADEWTANPPPVTAN